jgi:hypothetical protein
MFVLHSERRVGTRFNATLGTMVCVLTGFELRTAEYNYIPHT